MATATSLRAVTTSDPRWVNLLGMMAWVNGNPLPDDADPQGDQAQARALLVAAITAAQNRLQAEGNGGGSADPAYQAASQLYQAYSAGQYQREMPSALELWLAGLGLNIANPLAKVATYAAIGLAAYLFLPRVLQGMRGSKSA